MRATQLKGDATAAQPFERLAVEALGGAVAQQRTRARLDAERPLGPSHLRALAESFERVSRQLGLVAADGRLDQLGERPDRGVQLILRARALRVLERRRVLAQAVIENGAGVLG